MSKSKAPSTAIEILSRVVGVGSEGVLIAAGLPPTGVLAAAVTPLAKKALVALVGEQQRRTSVALAAAERTSGKTREEIDDLIAHDLAAVPIVLRLLQAAGNAGDDEVLSLLGGMAGAGLADPSTAQRQETLMLSIEGLTEAHVRMMAVLDREHIAPTEENESAPSWDARTISDWMHEERDVVRMLGMGLLSRGLVENPFGGFGGSETFGLSSLGFEVVRAGRAIRGEG